MADPTLIPPNIASLTAPMLFGHLFNYGCFGMLTVQVVVYYQSFPADSFRLKAFIYGLFAVECAQIAVATHDAYEDFGVGWGSMAALESGQLLWLTAVFSAIVSGAVQCFYAWRIYHLSGKIIYLSVFIAMVSLMQASGAMATGITSHLLSVSNASIEEASAKTRGSTIVWLAGSLICDVLIATSMLFFLSKRKQGLSTDAILSRIITLTVETGVLTATVACIDLSLFVAFPQTNYHFAPALVLSKLYSNSFMVLFNNRIQARTMRGGVHTSGGRVWFNTTDNGSGSGGINTDTRAGTQSAQEITLKKLPATVECEISTVVEQDYHGSTKNLPYGSQTYTESV
ncbi:hypothetical protein L226DRAFT_611205 [Lentinus tigrinus ALCF2SS1-7]|uniref:DUF6534 domain-containing protein n=1 Tax=Lentinus tigrinus ALCF2SS1-6 TaxID=1328759 RepID=A0A5C2RTV4_9APHY|nr:hypothetical protein L227DRAFT_603923 [Lentinus tigrinus ALCF2SS1-6]RPD76765.1 hypothetical protein L226DRAFT_611205 [Lentinus tigrinus ALCF2SS1-7]